MTPKSLLIVTKDLSDNSTGRAHVIWTLAQRMGARASVLSPKSDQMWAPLAGSPFEAAVLPPTRSKGEFWTQAVDAASRADLIIAVKPLAGSFGIGVSLHRRTSTPLLLDIDDPDIAALFNLRTPARTMGRIVKRPREMISTALLQRQVMRVPRIVSNPTLQRSFGGTLLPHARDDSGAGEPHTSRTPRVAFIGTNRPHKGVDLLRRATASLAHAGYTLVVADVAPPDAMAHETWVGGTSVAQGLDLVRRSDIVAIPSRAADPYSRAQLPAKLIDGMIAGRAIVASDLPPVRWALNGAGLLIPPGDTSALVEALHSMRDPEVRREFGQRARARALEHFVTEAMLPTFRSAIDAAVTGQVEKPMHNQITRSR